MYDERSMQAVFAAVMIKICLLGGGLFLLSACEWLAKQEFVEHIDVITAPRHAEEDAGDSGVSFYNFLTQMSQHSTRIGKISILVVESLDDPRVVEIMSNVDIGFSFGAAWIFKQRHIDLCRNLLNMHCTLLPQWRGGGGFSWQILADERRSSVTFHKIDIGVDTGDIVLSNPFHFPEGVNTPKQRSNYMQTLALPAFKELVAKFATDGLLPIPRAQDESFSSYFPRLNSQVQACIDWKWSPSEIVKFVTAFDDPYPGAFSYLTSSNAKIFLKKASVLTGEPSFHPFQAGIIYRINSNGFYICARNGALLVKEVFDEYGSPVFDKLKAGERIFTPQADIDKAMSSRFVYAPTGLRD